MDRNDILLVGLGGAGGRCTDAIMDIDPRFQGYFINISRTDIESLNNANSIIKNYLVLSNKNGVGRNRVLGKEFANMYGYNMIDELSKFQQKHLFFITSFGGGSGSSILATLLDGIKNMRTPDVEEGETEEEAFENFNKKITLVGILPELSSDTIILKNARDTWNEVIDNPVIDSFIWIDNDGKIIDTFSKNEREIEINNEFAEMFNSIFEIPVVNGINFDDGNLGNILMDKGSLYIYDLDDTCSSVEVAMKKAENYSPLCKPNYDNEKDKVDCGYIGLSLLEDSFDSDRILGAFNYTKEKYIGINEEKNLVLVSGLMPPINKMNMIEREIKNREAAEQKNTVSFKLESAAEKKWENETCVSSKPKPKRKLKKNLFKR